MVRILERVNELQAPLPPKSSGDRAHGDLRYLLEKDRCRGWREYWKGGQRLG